MKVALKNPARVLLDKGVYDLSESEARRLLALGIAEPVKVSAEPKPTPEKAEKPKKTRKKKEA